MTGALGSSRRRRIAAVATVLLAALAAGLVVLLASRAPTHAGADTGVPPGETTTAVTRRTLTESSTVDGTLGYGSALELYDRLSGTFTWLPSVGAVIERGGTLFRVDNLPVTLMYGSVPAYRALKAGVSDGPDVTELNANLSDLGFDPDGAITDDERFSEATAAAVRRWQQAEGLPETGEIELGRVIFAPGARRVTAVHVALGQDPPGGASADAPAHMRRRTPNRKRRKTPASKVPASKQPASTEPTSKAPADKEAAPTEPNSEAGAGAGMVVLTTTSTQQLVQLKVKAEQQQLARVGETAPVMLPGGEEVQGRIIVIGSVASEPKEGEKAGEKGTSPGGESEPATVPVTLALAHAVAHLDEAPVSVELVKSIRHDVLTVPASALTATAGGGYAIELLTGNRRLELVVTPGMFADGYVQVEGPGLRAGLTVIESE